MAARLAEYAFEEQLADDTAKTVLLDEAKVLQASLQFWELPTHLQKKTGRSMVELSTASSAGRG